MITVSLKNNRVWSETPYRGIEFCWLSEKTESGRMALLKMQTGAELPLHYHPGWEQIFILEGSLEIADKTYCKGDFILIDAQTQHKIKAKEPSQYMTISEKEGVTVIES
ncbi:cupin domain-containing protein [Vibrio salinus]|uniref:cupin domain-containing protein n=1 Tax=Vibrio salinus TaxID=2899784 RepID=UPI001E4D35DD|nr:cupin domain-containing protein [Vibrio salinus]MCE0495676.1 cupin domain-containing protein [Vibrio salinus]